MLKKFMVLFVIMLIWGIGISAVASSKYDADIESVFTLENLGIEVDIGINTDVRDNASADGYNQQDIIAIPQLRRASQSNPVTISSESDVRVLLDALAIIFELTDSSVYVAGDIIDALEEAELREYWSQGIRDLLRDENERAMSELAMRYSAEELYEMMFSTRRVDIPLMTLHTGQVWVSQAWLLGAGQEASFSLETILDFSAHSNFGIIEAGSRLAWGNTFFPVHNVQTVLNQWRLHHFVIITRGYGDQGVALRSPPNGHNTTTRVRGTIWLHPPF